VNRWLIARGKGHTAVHNTGIHGGPNVKVVGVVVALMAVFGTTVLTVEAFDSDDAGHGGGHGGETMPAHEETAEQDAVRGLAASEAGMTLRLERDQLPRAERAQLGFAIEDDGGAPVTDFEVEHERRLHLIVVRRDMRGFQHLHPRMSADGRWSTPITIDEPGTYRVFADFKRDGRNQTLARDITVPGSADAAPFPRIGTRAITSSGYEVELTAPDASAGEESELEFSVTRDGEHVEVEPYLAADGHLVALREGDLAYLHVHPTEGTRFETQFPTAARYALFLQFRHGGEVHTANFAREVGP
jgi:hypothetical protein